MYLKGHTLVTTVEKYIGKDGEKRLRLGGRKREGGEEREKEKKRLSLPI